LLGIEQKFPTKTQVLLKWQTVDQGGLNGGNRQNKLFSLFIDARN